MDLVYCLHLISVALWLGVSLSQLDNSLISKHVVWLLRLNVFIVLLDTHSSDKLVSNLKHFIHGGAPVWYTRVQFNFVRLFVDVLVGILIRLVDIHELGFRVANKRLDLAVFVIGVIGDPANGVNF